MRRAFILIWVVFLLCVCLSPWEVKAHLHSMGRHHYQFHLAAFAVTGILLVGSARSFGGRLLFSLLSVGFAFTTELLEQWRFHNPFEWPDVISDCEGILFGVAVVTLISALTRETRHHPSTTRTTTETLPLEK